MLEDRLALEKAQGYRGLATKLVGPIATASEADLVIRECCLGLFAIAGLQIALSVRMGYGSVTIGVAVLIAAVALRVFRGFKSAMIVFLACAVAALVGWFPWSIGQRGAIIIPILLLLFSGRALYATTHGRKLKAGEQGQTMPAPCETPKDAQHPL